MTAFAVCDEPQAASYALVRAEPDGSHSGRQSLSYFAFLQMV
jgi:hypothetical protein